MCVCTAECARIMQEEDTATDMAEVTLEPWSEEKLMHEEKLRRTEEDKFCGIHEMNIFTKIFILFFLVVKYILVEVYFTTKLRH